MNEVVFSPSCVAEGKRLLDLELEPPLVPVMRLVPGGNLDEPRSSPDKLLLFFAILIFLLPSLLQSHQCIRRLGVQ